MDEPVRSRLRPARPGGLTSPEPVTAPHRPPATRHNATADPEQGTPDKPQNSKRQEQHARGNDKISFARSGRGRNGTLNSRGGLRLRPEIRACGGALYLGSKSYGYSIAPAK